MKKALSLLLALALLTGCGGSPSPAEPEVLQDTSPAEWETVSPPESRRLEPISAPAVVTEGREPAEDYELPKTPFDLDNPELDFGLDFGSSPALLAELPEANAALYALEGGETVLIRWDNCIAEFDWLYITPRRIAPCLRCFDIDGDQEDELVILCYTGSGTSVSIWDMHIIEKNSSGILTDYALPQTLWQDQLPSLLSVALYADRPFIVLGHELVALNSEAPHLDLDAPPTAGLTAYFEFLEANRLCLCGTVNLSSGYPCYIADWSAELHYQDSVFTLQDFHLYSYEQ